MRKLLIASILAVAGIGISSNRASAAWHYGLIVRPYYTPAAFPMQTPAGYFTNSYYFAWHYPWYQNYNYSHGYYANWWMGGGYASYAGQQLQPLQPATAAEPAKSRILPEPMKEPRKDAAKKEAAKISILVPADAKVLFNGVAAGGKGETRTFLTGELNPDQDYEYVLTAEVTRDGEVMTATEYAIVRAGETTTVTLKPTVRK